MATLFLDLDNTLIYSHRHPPAGEKRVAERLDGREQSYITEATFAWLAAQRTLELVPVTTRTLPQYRRVEPLLGQLGCRRAMICNGGMLLRDGLPDAQWLDETRRSAAAGLAALPQAERLLRALCGDAHVHDGSGLFVYAACERPEETALQLRGQLDAGTLDVLCDRRKLYILPRAIDKGAAVRRYRLRFPTGLAIAAGDSAFDVPMLETADVAILPQALAACVDHPCAHIAEGRCCFSDEICSILTALCRSGPV